MDVKSVSRVGDMYKKFEALCVEVEDAMYQDTVKFVESQAKTVGTCFKRFYSDVMLDLLPPSSDVLMKPVNPNWHSADHPDDVIHDMSKVRIKRKPKKASNEKLSKDSYVAGQLVKEVEDRLDAKSLDECVPCKQTYEESFGVKCTNLNVGRSYFEDSNLGGSCEAGKVREEGDETKKYVASTSTISSLPQSLAFDEFENDEDASRVDGISHENETIQIQDEVESAYTNEQALQVSETGKMKLGESCVLVNKYESLSPSYQKSQQRSYKEKIKEVLYPRSWPRSKKQVQESGSNQVTRNSKVPASFHELGNASVQSNDSFFESGWEIL